MNAVEVPVRAGPEVPTDGTLEDEVRQSLSLLGLTAVAMALYVGVGLLAVRILG